MKEHIVGGVDELFDGLSVPGIAGEAGGDGEGIGCLVGEFGELSFTDGASKAFGGVADAAGVSGVGSAGWFGIPEDDAELIASDAGDDVVLADDRAHEFRGFDENLVSGGVSVLIVVGFEVIDIEDHEGDAEALLFGALEDGFEEAVEVAAIPDAGEGVFEGEVLEVVDLMFEGEPASEPEGVFVEGG